MHILLVHGVGHAEADPDYYQPWRNAIMAGMLASGGRTPITFAEFRYDDLFAQHYAGPGVYTAAFTELLASAAEQAVMDRITGAVHDIGRRPRAFEYGGDALRWHVGMVAQLVVDAGLRRLLRDRLTAELTARPADIVAAHSLGSLLTYDYLRNLRPVASSPRFHYLTFGAQINNAFVRSRLWPGRLMMPPVKSWTHLYNPHDPVLTADIRLTGEPSFHGFITDSAAGHSPVATAEGPGYLDHPITRQMVWPVLGNPSAAGVARGFARRLGIATVASTRPARRALLIGINAYPDPANRLDGCVNDTFLMSAVLQEHGFDPRNIRVLHNARATAAAIRERLDWLLQGVEDGMERVLFYSGHGAQLPVYGPTGAVDRVDECLVPYDFAWTPDTAITDQDLHHRYRDLPPSARFYAIFDCCHAGGLSRDGTYRVRGISPPDDIRHRLLRWNAHEGMWQPRADGIIHRLGRGEPLRRSLSRAADRALVRHRRGLYRPVLLEACRDDQQSFEYRNGGASYGAFTYALVKNLRAAGRPTVRSLIRRTADTLRALGYDQNPQATGPRGVLDTPIPVPRT